MNDYEGIIVKINGKDYITEKDNPDPEVKACFGCSFVEGINNCSLNDDNEDLIEEKYGIKCTYGFIYKSLEAGKKKLLIL